MRITTLIFDWGDTIMRDLQLPGPMKDWEHVEWVPGAEEMLQTVSPHFKCCIATSASHSDTNDMLAALRRVGAEKYFQYLLSSADLGFAKPDPDFFRSIVRLLKAEPAECISIGNLYLKDICPAKEAGLRTIWFNENKETGNFPEADHIIHSWQELAGKLGL